MKTYVINLKRRPDRLAALNLSIPYTLVEATDGQVVFPLEPSKRMRGHFGCFDSHMRVLRMIVESNDNGLVFEDDCIIPGDFEQALNYLSADFPKDWDIVYLGGNPRIKFESTFLGLDKVHEVYGTFAYIITPEFAQTILNRMQMNAFSPWKVDVVYSRFLPYASAYICSPPMVLHNNATQSDIDHNKKPVV